MQKIKRVFIYYSLLFLTVTSCVSKKKIVYFQNDTIDQSKVSNSYQTIFKPDDLINITISALDYEAVKSFNLPAVSYATTTDRVIGTPQQQSYLVDNEGYIDFPVLGKLKIGGLTRAELIAKLKAKLDPDYIKSPTINIRISNFKVTVLGNVNKPGTYTIPNERITILEAIGLAGDLNIAAKRSNIKLIREIDGKKVQYEIDLRSNKLFTSPVYYLQQNDIIYIEPNKSSYQDAAYNRNTGLFISVASVLVALISVLTR